MLKRLIEALIKFLAALFKPSRPAIPFPEEALNPYATMENTDLEKFIIKWILDYKVQPSDFIDSLRIELSPDPIPEMPYEGAATWADQRLIKIKPDSCSAGIIAHEVAHVSHYQLNVLKQFDFAMEFSRLLSTDQLLSYLYSLKPYMQTNIIEAHADVYRYLGPKMPESLKKYYPFLF